MYKEELVKALVVAERKDPTERIRRPGDAVPVFLRKIGNKKQEHFAVMSLAGDHTIMSTTVITKGITNRVLVHPREVFREAIKKNAVAIIVGHNHPSGQTQPSEDDRKVMFSLRDAGEILGIRVLDFLVVGKTGFWSGLEHNEL